MTSTLTKRHTGAVAKVRDSWGGTSVVLLALSVAATAVLSKLIDGTYQRTDYQGHRYLESAGNTGRLIAATVLLLAVAAALMAIWQAFVKITREPKKPVFRSGYAVLMFLLIVWWSFASVMRGEVKDAQSVFEVAAAIIIMVGVIASPPTIKTLQRLAHLLNVFSAVSLVYAYYNPLQQLPCRIDKCGIFGNMFTGFFYQENGAARVVVLLVPVAAAISSRWYLMLTLALATVYVAATGSRTSLLSLAIAIIIAVVVRRRLMGKSTKTTVPWPLRLAPLAALGASAYLFYTDDPHALTGRGEIYAGIRAQLHGEGLLLGTGSATVSHLILAFNALAFGEHGQMPHIAVRAGAVGVLLFTAAMFAVARRKHWTPIQAVGFSVLFVAATQFATEPSWELELRTMACTSMILTVGLLARTNAWQPKKLAPELQRLQHVVNRSRPTAIAGPR